METKAKTDSGRKELRLNEASKLLGWEVDDLIDRAAKKQLTIYVRNGLWDIKSIFYRKNPILVAIEKKLLDKNKLQEFYEEFQVEPELNGVNVDVHIDNKWTLLEKDTDIGRILYNQHVFGLTPVFPHSFVLFIEQHPFAYIDIGIGNEFKFPKSTEEFYAEMDPELLVKDALKDNKLYVMKSDFQKMLSEESSAAAVAKPKGVAGKKTVKGPRHGTLERYAEWQRRADEKIKKNPALSAYAVAEDIRTDLENEKSKFSRSVNAIRQHIKI